MAPPVRELQNPDRVATAVFGRRTHIGIAQDAVPGVSRSVMSLLENAGQTRYQVRNLVALGIALEWPHDWLERVEAGEDLTRYEAPPGGAPPSDLATRLDEVVDEVRELRQTVVRLATFSEDRLPKFDALLATELPALIERIERLEGRGRRRGAS